MNSVTALMTPHNTVNTQRRCNTLTMNSVTALMTSHNTVNTQRRCNTLTMNSVTALMTSHNTVTPAVTLKAHPVALEYTGLDPEASYTLSILFFASEFKNFKTERNSITAGASVLQDNMLSPYPMQRVYGARFSTGFVGMRCDPAVVTLHRLLYGHGAASGAGILHSMMLELVPEVLCMTIECRA